MDFIGIAQVLIGGFVTFMFGIFTIIYKKRKDEQDEQKKQKQKQREENSKQFYGPDGKPPPTIDAALRIAKQEGKNVNIPNTSGNILLLLLMFIVGSTFSYFFFASQSLHPPRTETPIPINDTETSLPVINTETPVFIITPTIPDLTETSTPTVDPMPIACNHPAVTKNLFPQLEDVDGQFPMYGPVGDSNFLCEAVYDVVHTPGKIAVHIKYENVGQNFGWWGVAIQSPDSYDASKHRQLCFWAYAQQPFQSFRVRMKDRSLKENGVIVTINKVNEWEQICTDVSEFTELGINVEQMDNINLGFEEPLGSAEIWVADFEFRN